MYIEFTVWSPLSKRAIIKAWRNKFQVSRVERCFIKRITIIKGKRASHVARREENAVFSFTIFNSREKVMDQFMISLDELNVRVEDNSKANAVLIEENRVLREEYRTKVQHFQAQVQQGKDIIDKLTEINVYFCF